MANNVTGQVQLLKKGSDNVFPITVPQAIVDNNGKNLNEILVNVASTEGAAFSGTVTVPDIQSTSPADSAVNKNYVDGATSNQQLVGKIYSPLFSQNSSATLSTDAAGKTFYANSTSAVTYTLPSSIDDSREVAFIRMGQGDVFLAAPSGVPFVMAGEASSFSRAKISEQYGMCAIKRIGNNYLLSGVCEKA